ncbi:restriction endonuclease [Ramlibacter sp. H39-3-26]|uniref:restriction endonuclease n=1 Tax=Curvibacter soli TaxID=3031331 RepID=UPI0023DA979A|nr:restriction endonuclease [Ramlibacter sp. H39-3-26]MDF1484657.1 restriction endonuclease [Ramlibacter sp. H39-3-26]
MAPNSLFAILLRSPWWISFALAAAIVLAAFAALPAAYAVFGALGALPMAVVGAVAAWRQRHAPSARRVDATLRAVQGMAWREFAAALEAGLRRDGYVVRRLPGPQADFLLDKAGRATVVGCRRWKAASHGVEPLRELRDAQAALDAQGAMYVAAAGALSDNARSFAGEHGIALVQAGELARLLRA